MKVLIGRNFMNLEGAIPDLEQEFPDVEFVFGGNDSPSMIHDADIYMGWLNRDVWLKAEKMKWLQSPSSGINYYLAIPEFVESDCILTSARGTHGACLAESAMAMIFAHTRGIVNFTKRQQQHKWSNKELRSSLSEMTDCTLGIIGLGMVGRSLAERARAFGPRIIAVDMFPKNKPDTVDELWGLDKLNDLMAVSDYVVVTVPYTPDTHHMIDAEQIAAMKPSAALIGISRGKIIVEEPLVEALQSDKLAFAALDVFAKEPLPEDSPLWDVENLLITPHIAGGTQYEGKYVIDIFRENLTKFLAGERPLRNEINKKQGF